MAIKDSSTVMRIIEKSRLLQLKDLEEARALSEQIPDSHEFLKQLFRKKKITRWQAGQLSAGNTSFFLGKYKLVELIGAGGMGRVFRAEHITMNRSVALKIIAKELVTDADAQKRFLNEARAIASLNHPNIVHAYSVDKEGDRYYIVMEFVEGTDLEKTVEKNGAVAQDRVAVFMHQAAGALQHAHERGMIHCDIKPANLLLNESEQIKILDMGLARFQNSDKGKADSNDLNQNVIGTVDYMAPEVAEDSANVSPQSDIYSLGCVMFFLLTGEIPFPGETIPERILKHQNGEPKNPTEINDAISPRLAEICLKMMARELSERYQSAEEVAEDLAQWLRSGMKEESESGSSSISLDFSNFAASDDSKSLKAASSKKSGFFGLSSKKKESSGSRIGLGKEEERIENGSENDQGKAEGLESHAADLEKRTKDTAKNFSVPDFSNLGNLEAEEKDESEGNPFEELAGIFGNSVGGTEKNLKLKENPGALNRSSKERPAPVSDEKSAIEDEYGDKILKATDKKRNSEEDEVREHSEPAEETVDRLNLDESSPNHEDLEETIVANEEELESDGEISEAGNEAKKLSKEKSKSGILDDFGSESDNLLSKKMKNEKTDSKDATSLEPWGILGDSLEKKVKNSSLDLTGKAEKSFSMPKLPAKKVWAERPDSHEAESQNKNKESKIKAMTVKLSEIFAGAIGWFVGLSSKQKIIYGSVAGGSCLVLLLVLIFCLGSGGEKEIAQKNAVEPMVEDIIDETVEEVSNESTDEDSTPDGENADGENANGEKADGEKADGEKADGEKADGEKADGENADGENANGENADGENADGENADGENADGENANGEKADGENANGEKANGEKADGEKADGEKANGEKADGENANGENADGENADGENADGENADGENADGEKADGEKADGENANGENADGENADGENADGENADGENADGENADGENADGENADSENADGENADGENADGENADGENAEEVKKAEEEAKKAEEEAKKKAALEPFKDTVLSVMLPEPETDEVEIAKIDDGGLEVTVSLLGGSTAFAVKSSGKKAAVQTKFFTLESVDNENSTWEIRYQNKEEESKAAVLTLEEGSLKFKWDPDESIPPKDLPILGNCALKLECNEKSHVLALREAMEFETLVFNPKTGQASVKGGKFEIPLPSLDSVYVEIVRVGEFAEDSKDLQLPEPMKASEISRKNPLRVNFAFTDTNGNAQTPVYFQFVPMFGNGFSGTLTPGLSLNGMEIPNPGKMIGQQMGMAQNPQIDLQITKWQKEISAIDQKNKDKAAHAKSPEDSAKQTELQLNIWMVGLMKQLVKADVEYRVYADMDGEQVDLITSKYVDPEAKKAQRKKSKSSKKRDGNDEPDSEEESDLGGFKF